MTERTAAEFSFRSLAPMRRTTRATLISIALLLLLPIVAYPALAGVALLVWALFTLTAAITVKTLATWRMLCQPEDTPAQHPAWRNLPHISIMAPLFREPEVASRLIERLKSIRYPKDKLEIVLVLEECDRATADALGRASLPPWIRTVIVPEGRPRTKPRAMNYALDFCRGDIIGIYDAEDAPDPDQLLRVARKFAASGPELACLQGALDYYNPRQNWLARCFTIEYNAWFRVVLPGMTRLGFAVPLGGTTMFVRRSALERVGRWDAHNVTEDADLGFRLARFGYVTGVIDTTTQEEANCRPLAWVRQRSRWIKGYMVTYLVHMRRPVRLVRELGLWQFLGFQLHFISTISQFLLAPFLWSLWLRMFGLPHPAEAYVAPALLTAVAVALILFELCNIMIGMAGLHRSRHRGLMPFVPTLIAYYPLGCIAAYKALAELFFAPLYWDKTEHGLSPDAAPARVAQGGQTAEADPESSLRRVTNA